MTTDVAEALERTDEEGPRYYGRVIIEWPRARTLARAARLGLLHLRRGDR